MILTPAVRVVANLIQAFTCEARAQKFRSTEFPDTKFRTSPTSYWAMLLLIGVGVWVLAGLSASRRPMIQFCFGVILILIGIFYVWFYAQCAVVVTRSSLEICFGNHREVVAMRDIKKVTITTTGLMIDTGEVPRKMVPFGYQNMPMMLAMLRLYAGKDETSS
ncbi:MAG: hypothetical protein HZA89_08380 [Verrucomicrobia bacterium]|nr:hypothetical protein [Verrucomicrobiota bacterium]